MKHPGLKMLQTIAVRAVKIVAPPAMTAACNMVSIMNGKKARGLRNMPISRPTTMILVMLLPSL